MISVSLMTGQPASVALVAPVAIIDDQEHL
jgi:hypothetical protein